MFESIDVQSARKRPWVHSIYIEYQNGKELTVNAEISTSYAGCQPLRIEMVFSGAEKPWVRVCQILYHGHFDDMGYPDYSFYEHLDWDASSKTVLYVLSKMKAFIENPPAKPAINIDELREMWRSHDPQCHCDFFRALPFAYEKLTALPKKDQIRTLLKVARDVADMRHKSETAAQLRRNASVLYAERALTPKLFGTRWCEEWFEPSFADLLRNLRRSRSPAEALAALNVAVHEEAHGVFSFPMLSDACCNLIIDELRSYESSGLPKPRPNSMNNYGLVLNEIGMERMFDDLVLRCVRPIASLLFDDCGGQTLDRHHSFLVEYREGQDLSLDMHVDDSDVTLNINLLDGFEGSALCFCGYQSQPDHRQHSLTYMHRRGVAVLHAGKRRHGALPLSGGERVNLIVWCRSAQYRWSEEYEQSRRSSTPERSSPDLMCLSRAHDKDYDAQHRRIMQKSGSVVGAQAPKRQKISAS